MTLFAVTDAYFTAKLDKSHLYQIERILSHFGNHLMLWELEDADVQAFARARRATPTNRGTLPTPATVNREIEMLRAIWKYGKKTLKARTGDEPDWSEAIEDEPKERVRSLSPAEEKALFDNLPDELADLIVFAFLTGARLSNCINLRWCDVRDNRGIIVLTDMKGAAEGDIHELPITPQLRDLLNRKRGQHDEFVFTYLCRRSRKARPGFEGRVRGSRYRYTATNWRSDWKAALKAAGVFDFRFHDLRHTTATRLLSETGNLKLVAKVLGHANIATTTKYAHVDHDQMAAAMTAISQTIHQKEG